MEGWGYIPGCAGEVERVGVIVVGGVEGEGDGEGERGGTGWESRCDLVLEERNGG